MHAGVARLSIRIALLACVTLLSGCRYDMVDSRFHGVIYRIDRWSGEVCYIVTSGDSMTFRARAAISACDESV